MRPVRTVDATATLWISIHAPLAGCDRPSCSPKTCRRKFQSTHPLRGATCTSRSIIRMKPDFNPRTPCGVRLELHMSFSAILYFNPRTPCGVRRAGCLTTLRKSNFNPRTPCGVRPLFAELLVHFIEFQSTHPLRGATPKEGLNELVILISIHAPLAGCDV